MSSVAGRAKWTGGTQPADYYAAYHRCQPLAPNVAGLPGAMGGSHQVFCLELMDTR